MKGCSIMSTKSQEHVIGIFSAVVLLGFVLPPEVFAQCTWQEGQGRATITTYVDLDSDGKIDKAYEDTDKDGNNDKAYLDRDDDGDWDAEFEDTDDDGDWDRSKHDTDGDGKYDKEWIDADGDNKVDAGEVKNLNPQEDVPNGPKPVTPSGKEECCEVVGGCPDLPEFPSFPVPTVSEWGLTVVTLLAMTIGTIILARRREKRVAETG